MASPLRRLNGVSSVTSDDPMGDIPYLDPTKWITFMDDFALIPDAGEAWTHTNTNGTLAVAADTTNDVPTITTQTLGGADNDLSQLYPATATMTITAAKKAVFEAKIKVDKGSGGTIGQQELFLGLSSAQTGADFMASDGLSMAVDDCVGFVSYDGSANINCIVRDTDVESVDTGATTYADATWYTLSWRYNGAGTVKFYANDSEIASLTDIPEDTALTPMMFIKGGEAKASVLSTDYIFYARER